MVKISLNMYFKRCSYPKRQTSTFNSLSFTIEFNTCISYLLRFDKLKLNSSKIIIYFIFSSSKAYIKPLDFKDCRCPTSEAVPKKLPPIAFYVEENVREGRSAQTPSRKLRCFFLVNR